jgi:hypothetical protein
MTLPFTHAQFLDLLGVFNTVFWPAELSLWILTLIATVQWLRGRASPRSLAGLLTLHWAWSGVAYHALYFTRINSAAWFFASLFVLAAAGFAWHGLFRRRLAFRIGWEPRHVLARFLVLCALAYPGLALLTGLEWPRMPAFGVPCPTTLFTAGILLTATPPVPRSVFMIPIVWGVIGGSAAVSLGIVPDYLLFVAALGMLGYAVVAGRRTPAHAA